MARRFVGAAEVAEAVTVEAGLGRSVVSRVVKKGDRHTPERNVRVKGEEKTAKPPKRNAGAGSNCAAAYRAVGPFPNRFARSSERGTSFRRTSCPSLLHRHVLT